MGFSGVDDALVAFDQTFAYRRVLGVLYLAIKAFWKGRPFANAFCIDDNASLMRFWASSSSTVESTETLFPSFELNVKIFKV